MKKKKDIDVTEIMVQEQLKNIPKLYGATEFGNAVGWYVQKVCIYNSRRTMPTPAVVVGNRPLWTEYQVIKFAHDKELPLNI